MNLPCLRESCPNFLRPIYHSLSANQAPRRGMPHEKYQYRLQLLFFYLIVTWPTFNCHGTDLLGGRYTTTVSYWSLTDAVCFKLHYLQVSVPEPCPITDAFRQPLDRLLENVIVFCSLCWYWTFDILQQFFRVISYLDLQDIVNHPYKLADYHD